MTQEERIKSLEAENAALRRENGVLRRRCLRILMERAILDDEMSQNIIGQMAQFFPEDCTAWYLCVLFFGNAPKQGDFPASDPMETVEALFTGVLAPYGQCCFFDACGTIACLLNVSPEYPDPTDSEYLSRLTGDLSAVLKDAAASADLSHIALSRPGRMTEGPRPLYRGAISASEHRTDSAPAVWLEPLHQAPNRQDRYQVLALERTFWRQIQMRAFYDAAVTLDRIIEYSQRERGNLDRIHASVFSRMELVFNLTFPDGDSDRELTDLLGQLSQVKSYREMQDAAYDILATLEDRTCEPAGGKNRKLPAIERYIRTRYSDRGLDVNSIAAAFKISPSYLSRVFKQSAGMGLVDYIHHVRVEAAKTLLSDRSLNLDAVAEKVGFSSRGVLNRVFKDLEGMTPGAYREMI